MNSSQASIRQHKNRSGNFDMLRFQNDVRCVMGIALLFLAFHASPAADAPIGSAVPGSDWAEQAAADAQQDRTTIAFDDNRHRAVCVAAKLPPLP
jgi:hypothetical protein